jgi:hypothetical protein
VVVPCDQGGQCRHHEGRSEPFQDRPAEREHQHVRGEGGDGRADGVDDQTDGERPTTSDEVTDLAAHDHEHRHDQRVQGDHPLDHGDAGVEVGDELADRDVHDGLVQDHHELRRRQDDQRSPLAHHRGSRSSTVV